ncbi:MAG: hypothetical protein HY903_13470 [Deltaproteobacteria bacterium]|nr:hypothetical protein [Deltaproteobacteria bacterium]
MRAERATGDSGSRLPPELSQGFEREVRGSLRLLPTPADPARQVTNAVGARIAALAADPKAFHDLMRQVFGAGYDAAMAEQFRQAAVAGDLSWLPPVRFVGDATLGGANGAYDSAANVIYINSRLCTDASAAAEVYAHELGHFLDAVLNRTDTVGEEGELFRLLFAGAAVSAVAMARIRADDSTGVMVIDGEAHAVEFWNPVRAVADAVSSVGKAVGDAVSGVVAGVGDACGSVFRGVGGFFESFYDGLSGFFASLWRGNFGDALQSLYDGTVIAVLKSGRIIVGGVIDGAQAIVDALTYLCGPLGRLLRKLNARAFGAAKAAGLGLIDAGTGALQGLGEAGAGFVRGAERLLCGDLRGAAREWRQAGVHLLRAPLDLTLMTVGNGISAVQTLLGLEPPGRKLTAEEIAYLRSIYGDSIDYSQVEIKQGNAGLYSISGRPFALGNTIYLQDITDRAVLVHEMAHVWQFQNGGSEYALDSLREQSHGADAYDWKRSVPQTAWENLGVEQQAALVEAAARAGFFNPNDPRYGVFSADVNGDGVAEDLTVYLRHAVAAIRAGRGAP